MGKYEPLAEYLKKCGDDSWDASFSEIEEILGFALPPSAHEHRAWWANQYKGNHSQAKGWIAAGWETREIDQRQRRVRFERLRQSVRRSRTMAHHDLWRQAQEMTGIDDRDDLERAALTALIQRYAGQSLARMGGAMPELNVPARERPTS